MDHGAQETRETGSEGRGARCRGARRGRRLRGLLGVGLLVGVLAAGASALAGPGHHRGHGGFPGMMFLRMLGKLDLTEPQEVEAVRLRRAVAEDGLATRKALHGSMGQVIGEVGKAQPDARKVHAAIDQGLERVSKLMHGAVDRFLALHATFTPAQRQELSDTLRKHHDRMGKHLDERDDD